MMICFFGLAILGGLWAPISSFPEPWLPSVACCRRSASPTSAATPSAGRRRTSPTSRSWRSMRSSSAGWRLALPEPRSSAPVADRDRTGPRRRLGSSTRRRVGAVGASRQLDPRLADRGSVVHRYPIVRILTGRRSRRRGGWCSRRPRSSRSHPLGRRAAGSRRRAPSPSPCSRRSIVAILGLVAAAEVRARPTRAGSRCSTTPRPPPACSCPSVVPWP